MFIGRLGAFSVITVTFMVVELPSKCPGHGLAKREGRIDHPNYVDAEVFESSGSSGAKLSEEELTKLFGDIPSGRIIGGVETKPHEFPSIVSLQFNERHTCGGTIIGSEWIMGAAHCAKVENAAAYIFYAGKHDRVNDEDSEQKVATTTVIKHKYFNPLTLRNDIALYKITPPFKFNEFVQPAKLPDPEVNKTGYMTVVGWGTTNPNDNSQATRKLRKVDVPIIPVKVCEDVYNQQNIHDFVICAGAEKDKDTCYGDSGGPMYDLEGGTQTVLGITSWGSLVCGTKGKPTLYTKVGWFLPWIKANTKIGRNSVSSDSDNSRNIPVWLSTTLAQSVCKQYGKYGQLHAMELPVKAKPQDLRG